VQATKDAGYTDGEISEIVAHVALNTFTNYLNNTANTEILKFVLFVTIASIISLNIQAQVAPVNDDGIAIGGYDVVSYFSGEAERGFASYAAGHNGTTYHFSTKANLEAFQKSPNQYLPQFDGYCAWGVGAKETKFPVNPETYDIVDGKLYLFFNGPFNGEPFNTLQPWNSETTKLLTAAHQNWDKVKSAN